MFKQDVMDTIWFHQLSSLCKLFIALALCQSEELTLDYRTTRLSDFPSFLTHPGRFYRKSSLSLKIF